MTYPTYKLLLLNRKITNSFIGKLGQYFFSNYCFCGKKNLPLQWLASGMSREDILDDYPILRDVHIRYGSIDKETGKFFFFFSSHFQLVAFFLYFFYKIVVDLFFYLEIVLLFCSPNSEELVF